MDLHFETAGEGRPILFLHAGVADSRMWGNQMGLDGYRTIAFDQRGFGRTPWRPTEYSDREDALAVLDHLGIDSAMIVGASMGGGTALELAIDHPDRVDGLVLVGAYPRGWTPEEEFEDSPLEEEAVAAFKANDLEQVVEIDYLMWLVGYGRPEDEVDRAHKELFFDMDRIPVPTEEERNRYRNAFTKTINDHLDEITAPTLVVVGAHDEPVLVAAAEYLADCLSSQPATVIENAAHLPSLEEPTEFNTALTRFLDAN